MAAADALREILHKAGYRATKPRLAILAAIKKSSDPLSVQKIANALAYSVDQATIYRTVKSMKDKGVLRQIDLRHNHAHYELAYMKRHHHLVCVKCGRIEDVHHCNVEAVQGAVIRESRHFAEITQHALEFYGLCKACSNGGNI